MSKLIVSSAIFPDRDGRSILVGKRKGYNDGYDGLYCTPGGKVEENETIEESVVRECREEIGVQVNRMSFICFNEPKGFLIFYYLIVDYTNEPVLLEPEKCEGWDWVSWSLPMTPGLQLLKATHKNWLAYRSALHLYDKGARNERGEDRPRVDGAGAGIHAP